MLATVLILTFLLLALLGCAAHAKQQNARFRERFPPITEAEFLARCPEGTNPEIALRVRRIVAEQLGVDYDRVYPESRFVEDLGAD